MYYMVTESLLIVYESQNMSTGWLMLQPANFGTRMDPKWSCEFPTPSIPTGRQQFQEIYIYTYIYIYYQLFYLCMQYIYIHHFCGDLHASGTEMRFFKHCFVTWRKSCVVEASEEDNNIIFPWQFQFCAALSLVFCPWHQWFVLHFHVTKGANRLASNLSVQEKMDKRFPDFHMIIPNVTYLFWLNCFGLRLNCFFR